MVTKDTQSKIDTMATKDIQSKIDTMVTKDIKSKLSVTISHVHCIFIDIEDVRAMSTMTTELCRPVGMVIQRATLPRRITVARVIIPATIYKYLVVTRSTIPTSQ